MVRPQPDQPDWFLRPCSLSESSPSDTPTHVTDTPIYLTTMLDISGRHTHAYDRHTHSPSGHTHSPTSHLSNGHTPTHPIKPAAAAIVSSQRCSSTSLKIVSMYLITTGTAGSTGSTGST